MNIVYYTSGMTGSGRIVRGISIGNALRRSGLQANYVILNSSNFAFLADIQDFNHIEIPMEDEEILLENIYKESRIYQTLMDINPEILLVDLLWFPLYHFINELPCKKIFLCRQVDDNFFNIDYIEHKVFNHDDYDLILGIEPFSSSIPMKSINPIVIRNRNEIIPREIALQELKLDSNQKVCFLSYSGHPQDFKKVKKTYSYLEDEYHMVYSNNYDEGIFPIVDYFNAADLIICGAGYNSFWEAVYFEKEAIFIPTQAQFESGERRIRECQEFNFTENGADQLVDIMMNL